MEIPSGYKEVYQEAESDTVLKLQMAMYGLVQAARQWFKRLNTVLKLQMTIYGSVQAAQQWFEHLSDVFITLGFTLCELDPCLMYRVNENGLCIILMYVDDNLIVGSSTAIDQVADKIKKVFNVTISPEATEYLG